jgi:hypothetical protein
MFFQQWKLLFGEVCGYDIDTPTDRITKLAEYYGILEAPKPAELMFALHSYYALFIKLLSAEIVAFFHKLPTPVQRLLKASNSRKLKEEIEDLESGSIFRYLNITNFLEGDFFSWYQYSWDDSIEKIIRSIANEIDEYNPGTLSEDPEGSRDLLKKLYEQLFPKTVRHDLGEYYTPDWLAEHVLNELQYAGNPEKRILDPACGSGTFIIAAINRARVWYEKNRETCNYSEGDLLRKILSNIVGFDLNPLAVMTARTNYLISIRDLVSYVEKVEIPIYLCDSIVTPSEYGGIDTYLTGEKKLTKELKTSVAKFRIPLEIATSGKSLAQYCELLESCVKGRYEPNEFIQRCRNEGVKISAEEMHIRLYKQLFRLDEHNQNGIWARIIKNAFAPIFCGKFELVIGNPPWINWNNLPNEYRSDTEPIWRKYDLWPTYLLGAYRIFRSFLSMSVAIHTWKLAGGWDLS